MVQPAVQQQHPGQHWVGGHYQGGRWVAGNWLPNHAGPTLGRAHHGYGQHHGYQRRGYNGGHPRAQYGVTHVGFGALAQDLSVSTVVLERACDYYRHHGTQRGHYDARGQYHPSPVDGMGPLEVKMLIDSCHALAIRRGQAPMPHYRTQYPRHHGLYSPAPYRHGYGHAPGPVPGRPRVVAQPKLGLLK